MSGPSYPEAPAPVPPFCGVCGGPLAEGLMGAQCPRCLLLLGTRRSSEEDEWDEALLNPLQVKQFGHYKLLEEIARGGMGIVYRAWQPSLAREVAVKVILAGELAGREALRMFQREAHAAAQLHHPNIVPVYEIGEHGSQPYFTMRLVLGGKTIADWAATRRGDWRALAAAVAVAARAVAYAHTHGVLHRDLKPSNILWDADAGPQVTDFGLAKLLGEADGTMTYAVQGLGSPSYMAPEQMNGRVQEISTATDVYGLGAVLYEVLAGRPPFLGTSVMETMRKAADDPPDALPVVPRELRTVCFKCLSKKQLDRYDSAAALAEDLERFSRGEPVSALPLPAAQKAWRWAQRRPAMATLLALCVSFLTAGVVGIAWQWRRTEHARAAQSDLIARLQWEEIGRWLEDGETSKPLAYLASLIRAQPDRWQAVMYAMSIVEQNALPLEMGPGISPPSPIRGRAALAPDGSWLAAAGEDQIVRVWEATSGQETAQIPFGADVSAVACSAGPAKLAVALEDGSLWLVPDPESKPLALQRTLTGPLQELRFTSGGLSLLAKGESGVEVWAVPLVPSGGPLLSLPGEWKGAEISSGGTRVLVWQAGKAAVWETGAARPLLQIEPAGRFSQGSLSADGSHVAFIESEFSARTWQVVGGKSLPSIASPLTALKMLALDHSGTRLTLVGRTNDLKVFDTASGLPVGPAMLHHYDVTRLVASPDGRSMLSFGFDGLVNMWDAQTGKRKFSSLWLGGSQPEAQFACSTGGERFLVQLNGEKNQGGSLRVWRSSQRHKPRLHEIPGRRDFTTSCLSPDGRMAALGTYPDTRCHVYEPATGRVILDAPARGDVYVPLFSPDGTKCYALTANGWIHGWSLTTGEELWEPHRQPGAIRPGALSPDGTRIIAGHNDGHIRIYDTSTGALVRTLVHAGEVKTLRFAPDGRGRFLSGSSDRTAHLWDLQTGKKLRTFTGHLDTIIAGAWSPDSRYVATASYDGTARVWDAATGNLQGTPMAHLGQLSHLEFSPDGSRLATASRDGTARLWHPHTSLPASPPIRQGMTCQTVRFTADGAALLVYDHSGFRFWDTIKGNALTVQHPEPVSGGMGMDSANWRAIMSPDGHHVFLGYSMNYGASWSIPQPRQAAPDWFPAFLEKLAQMRISEDGEIRLLPPQSSGAWPVPAGPSPPGDPYARWAQQIIGS